MRRLRHLVVAVRNIKQFDGHIKNLFVDGNGLGINKFMYHESDTLEQVCLYTRNVTIICEYFIGTNDIQAVYRSDYSNTLTGVIYTFYKNGDIKTIGNALFRCQFDIDGNKI